MKHSANPYPTGMTLPSADVMNVIIDHFLEEAARKYPATEIADGPWLRQWMRPQLMEWILKNQTTIERANRDYDPTHIYLRSQLALDSSMSTRRAPQRPQVTPSGRPVKRPRPDDDACEMSSDSDSSSKPAEEGTPLHFHLEMSIDKMVEEDPMDLDKTD